jgi:ppGpp synthetase/RelA/SpoT-type nucleotidyltranferase
MVNTEGFEIVVSQRLKRLPRIVRKLDRMSSTNLARLEDIGGCRAILADGPALTRVETRLRRNWGTSIVRDRNYIDSPKDIGYRAVHLVIERDDRRIEVQLRTRGQQEWAEAIEAIDARRGLTMKDGEGPPELITYFGLAGRVIHAREYGLELDWEIFQDFVQARQAVIRAGYYDR